LYFKFQSIVYKLFKCEEDKKKYPGKNGKDGKSTKHSHEQQT